MLKNESNCFEGVETQEQIDYYLKIISLVTSIKDTIFQNHSSKDFENSILRIGYLFS